MHQSQHAHAVYYFGPLDPTIGSVDHIELLHLPVNAQGLLHAPIPSLTPGVLVEEAMMVAAESMTKHH